MIVAVDIGNTSITVALLKGQRVSCVETIDVTLSREGIVRQLNAYFRSSIKNKKKIELGIVCSVVPRKTNIVTQQIRKVLSIPVQVIGKDLTVPIKNNYSTAKQVGQDRLIGAYAVKKLYGFPMIIVDFGTAITFDVVNARGDYDGGIIVPGIRLSVESLFAKTALLPRIETIKTPRSLIGKNTKESILSGIFYGYGAMCNGLIDEITREIKGIPGVIITGGYTQMMKRFIKKPLTRIDRHLVFKGIAFLHQEFSAR